MSKIKEIQDRLLKNPEEYSSIRFLVSKQIFVINAALYFLVYLFTVGGFYFGPFTIDSLAIICYHLYSLVVISVAFFGYSLVEYFTDNKIVKIVSGVIFALFVSIALAVHVGLIG